MNRLRKQDSKAFLSPGKSPEDFAEDVAELRRVLEYNPDTGDLCWTHVAGSRGPAKHGSVAGCIRPLCGGYRWITVNYVQHRAHVLAWIYVNGVFPTDVLDHINGNPADNRIANLRSVSQTANNQNQRKPHSNNTTGYLGVSLDKRRNKFAARIRVPEGAYLFLGYHATAKKAHSAYVAAKRRLHEGCML